MEGRLHSTHLQRDNTDDETETPVRHKYDTADPEALLHGGDSVHTDKSQKDSDKEKVNPKFGTYKLAITNNYFTFEE